MWNRVLIGVATLVLSFPCAAVNACQFGSAPTPLVELLVHSHNVGVVRVVSSEIEKEVGGMTFIDLHVKRIETLRGRPYPIRTIRYTKSSCVDLRFDVGDYFLLVTDNKDQDFALGIFGENMVSLYAFGYLPPEAWAGRLDPSVALVQLRRAIAGKGELPRTEISEGYKRTSGIFNSVSGSPQLPQTNGKLKR